MDIWVRLRSGLRDKLTGVTGDPTEVTATVQSGFYRDQFTLDVDATWADRNKEIYFPGKGIINPNPEFDISIQTPAFVAGAGIIPTGDVVIDRETNDSESKIQVSSFKVAVSDEVAHEPLRQISYQESYWAFPVNKDGILLNCMYRKAVVDGWSNADEDD